MELWYRSLGGRDEMSSLRLLSSSAPGVHHGERASVGVVLLKQRLETRVVAEGVPDRVEAE